jgi:transcriptional regulator with XRE-family HTH domain
MANEISKIREKYKLTQAELAKMLDVSVPRISQMENQKTVTVQMLRRIAKKLGVSIKDLVNNNTE